jgi:hypothetical protein
MPRACSKSPVVVLAPNGCRPNVVLQSCEARYTIRRTPMCGLKGAEPAFALYLALLAAAVSVPSYGRESSTSVEVLTK